MPCDKPLHKEFTITFIIIVSHLLKLNFYRKIVFPIGNQYSYRKVPIGIQELPAGISIPLGFDKSVRRIPIGKLPVLILFVQELA